jgi:hypothetical protein
MIELVINKKTHVIKIQGDNAKDVIKQAAFFEELPTGCPECGANVRFTYRVPDGNEFYGLICEGKVSHETTFGIYKDSKRGLFYKPNVRWQHFERRAEE